MMYSLWMYATNPIVIFTCVVIALVVNGFFKAFLVAFGIGFLFSIGMLYDGATPNVFVILSVTFVETFITYLFKKNYFLLIQSD